MKRQEVVNKINELTQLIAAGTPFSAYAAKRFEFNLDLLNMICGATVKDGKVYFSGMPISSKQLDELIVIVGPFVNMVETTYINSLVPVESSDMGIPNTKVVIEHEHVYDNVEIPDGRLKKNEVVDLLYNKMRVGHFITTEDLVKIRNVAKQYKLRQIGYICLAVGVVALAAGAGYGLYNVLSKDKDDIEYSEYPVDDVDAYDDTPVIDLDDESIPEIDLGDESIPHIEVDA